MTRPDVTGYVDLRLTDVTSTGLVERGLVDAVTKWPEWKPREGNTEVVTMEAHALIVTELVYAVNRLPGALTEILLRSFGAIRDPGAAPRFTLALSTSNTGPITIPAGTRFGLNLGSGLETLELTLDAGVNIAAAGTTTAPATAVTPTLAANTVTGAVPIDPLDAVAFLTAATATVLSPGRSPEDAAAFLDRGIIRLRRLVETLTLPSHFTAAVLEDVRVKRARTVDLTDTSTVPAPAQPTGATATTGGTLAAGTYSYRVTALNANGETPASLARTVVTTGTTSTTTVTWTTPNRGTADPVTGYRIYGRLAGSEGLLASVGLVLTYTDTGTPAPGAAPPTANTTTSPPGTDVGHVTTAVAGPNGALLSDAVKLEIENSLEAQALAALDVHVVDVTIVLAQITAAVTATAGYADATVIADVTAALNGYLNPDSWQFDSALYRNELIALLDRTPAVRRVVTLTITGANGAGDLVLNGVAPLVKLGATTITVTAGL